MKNLVMIAVIAMSSVGYSATLEQVRCWIATESPQYGQITNQAIQDASMAECMQDIEDMQVCSGNYSETLKGVYDVCLMKVPDEAQGSLTIIENYQGSNEEVQASNYELCLQDRQPGQICTDNSFHHGGAAWDVLRME